MELFDYIEVFYNQRRRHSTLGQISPAAYERRLVAEAVDAAGAVDAQTRPPLLGKPGRPGFPQRPQPSSSQWYEGRHHGRQNGVVNLSTGSDQAQGERNPNLATSDKRDGFSQRDITGSVWTWA